MPSLRLVAALIHLNRAVFFFSSRRRHTRWPRDWSSDVCSSDLKMPPEQAVIDNLTPEQRKFYETFVAPDFNAPFAWAQGSRRLGADKDGDYVWVGNSFGGTLGRIDIRTKEIKLVPLPNPEAHQPYQMQVDSKHNVWTNLWSTDKVARYDPGNGQWTVRPSEPRH